MSRLFARHGILITESNFTPVYAEVIFVSILSQRSNFFQPYLPPYRLHSGLNYGTIPHQKLPAASRKI
jgi:hypothetical protein